MNRLIVGADKAPILHELPPRFLFIDDGPLIDQLHVRARRFDVSKHAFNPLKDMDRTTPEGYLKAREFIDVLNAVFPEGESTLTRKNSNFVLLNALLDKPRKLDSVLAPNPKDPAVTDAYQKIQTLLLSPVLERVLNTGVSFPFKGSAIIARLNRAELGDFDAFVLGNFLISQYPGPVIIPDFGFYACASHTSLIRQDRLIAGIHSFDLVPKDLRSELILIEEKIGSCTTPEDAELLARYDCPFPPNTNEYNAFIERAIGARRLHSA